MRRYCLHLTETEMADVIWAAHEGIDQVFGFTNPEADYGMTKAEFEAWEQRVTKALATLELAANDGGLLP